MSTGQLIFQSPASWPRKRLKYLVRFAGGGTPDKGNADFWSGTIPWVSPKDMKVSEIYDTEDHLSKEGLEAGTARLMEPGAVLLVVRSGILRHSIPVAVNRVPVTVNQDMRALIPGAEIKAGFLARLIEGHQRQLLDSWSKEGTTVESLESELIADTQIPVPPQEQQERIVSYLDHETAHIDALVAEKERWLLLLAEKRRALVTRAVTRGLNPDAPIKNSQVSWLGEVPAHWVVKRLKYLTPDDRPIMYGIVLPGPHVEDGVPIVKGGDVKAERLRLHLLNRTTHEIEAGYVRARLRGGDIVFAIRGGVGDAEIVPEELTGANLTQDAARIAPGEGVNVEWLLYALKSSTTFAQVDAFALGATIRGLNIFDLKRLNIPVPPPSEQSAIVAYIQTETRKLDALREAAENSIALLKERRMALIAAAVTGKIAVT